MESGAFCAPPFAVCSEAEQRVNGDLCPGSACCWPFVDLEGLTVPPKHPRQERGPQWRDRTGRARCRGPQRHLWYVFHYIRSQAVEQTSRSFMFSLAPAHIMSGYPSSDDSRSSTPSSATCAADPMPADLALGLTSKHVFDDGASIISYASSDYGSQWW